MACTPFNYTNYSTGNASCTSHRDACSTNRSVSLSTDFGVQGHSIRADDIEALRAKIIAEVGDWDAWNYANRATHYSFTDPGTISQNQVINHSHIDNLNDDLATLKNYTATSTDGNGGGYTITDNGAASDPGVSKVKGDPIDHTTWNSILTSYNTIRQDCICNSDCHCNTVCTCYGNCGCNYSDERLKENIELIDNKDGLNVYSYTYLWDKTKTYIGVMAQELLGTKYESALGKDSKGYYYVDYSKLPVNFKRV